MWLSGEMGEYLPIKRSATGSSMLSPPAQQGTRFILERPSHISNLEAELRRWRLLFTAEPILFFWQITQDPLPHFNAYFFIFRIKYKGDSCSPLLFDILISGFRALLGRKKIARFDYITFQKSISLWNFQLAEVA